jgi:SAM-dependent methyltransferase
MTSTATTEPFAPGSDYYDVSTDNLLASPLVRKVADEVNQSRGNVLDIGCGRGAFANLLNADIEYTGFDITVPRYQGQPTDSRTNRTVMWGDACQLYPYPNSAFQNVVSFWCLEHLPDPRAMLREAVRVLAPGGTLHLVFPNYDNPLRRCPSWWCDRGLPVVHDDSIRALRDRLRISNIFRQVRRRAEYFTRQFSKQIWLDLTQLPVFEINPDPAHIHLPWARDRDAIHIVSGRSVVMELRKLGLEIRQIRPGGWLAGLPFVGLFFRREPEYSIEATKS